MSFIWFPEESCFQIYQTWVSSPISAHNPGIDFFWINIKVHFKVRFNIKTIWYRICYRKKLVLDSISNKFGIGFGIKKIQIRYKKIGIWYQRQKNSFWDKSASTLSHRSSCEPWPPDCPSSPITSLPLLVSWPARSGKFTSISLLFMPPELEARLRPLAFLLPPSHMSPLKLQLWVMAPLKNCATPGTGYFLTC